MKNKIKKLCNAVREIISDWLFHIFVILDIISFFQQFYTNFKIEQKYFILILITGIVFSSIKIIIDKNEKINDFEEKIKNKIKPTYIFKGPTTINNNYAAIEEKSFQELGDTSIIKR